MNSREMRTSDDRDSERLRSAARAAFHRTPDLAPPPNFVAQLRERLRAEAASQPRPISGLARSWLAIAAGVVLVAGMATPFLLTSRMGPADMLARDAVGDHWNCALKFRLVRTPVPLEDAADQFDAAYRLLLTAPPDAIDTDAGQVRVTERHACAFGARRFGHVVMEYRGHVVSLLMTARDAVADARDAVPHVIGGRTSGLSVVSVDGAGHAILLVGDVSAEELTVLSRTLSVSLLRRLAERTASTEQRMARANER